MEVNKAIGKLVGILRNKNPLRLKSFFLLFLGVAM